MANILGIFTAIILVIAAFAAFKNNERLEKEITDRDNRLAELKVNQKGLEDAQAVLDRLPKERAAIDAQIAEKPDEETELKTAKQSMEAEIRTKTAKIESNRRQLDEIRAKIARVGDIDQLESRIKQMRIEREELQQTIAANEASLANLTERNEVAQAEADRRKRELDTLSKGLSLPTLNTRLRSIYPNWGFVTLADGNNAGVTANSTLDVVRDGNVIAKLLVTAVEARSASASIIPDSIGDDVTLMVGDRVVPEAEKQTPDATAAN